MTRAHQRSRPACTGSSSRPGVLPQAAERLDTRRELWPDEVRIRVERLNLDAASFRQLERTQHDGDGDAVRAEVLDDRRDPRQDAEPGHRLGRHARRHRRGGRPASPPLGLAVGDRVATLVSLTLTPLVDRATAWPRWDGRGEQVPVRRVRRSCSAARIAAGAPRRPARRRSRWR